MRLKSVQEYMLFKNSKTGCIYMAMLQGVEWADWLWLMDFLNPMDVNTPSPAVVPGFTKPKTKKEWKDWAKPDDATYKDLTVEVLNSVADLPSTLRRRLIEMLRKGDVARWLAAEKRAKDPTVQGNPPVSTLIPSYPCYAPPSLNLL